MGTEVGAGCVSGREGPETNEGGPAASWPARVAPLIAPLDEGCNCVWGPPIICGPALFVRRDNDPTTGALHRSGLILCKGCEQPKVAAAVPAVGEVIPKVKGHSFSETTESSLQHSHRFYHL